ncbi:hypothetical protein ABH944_002512 [Caballeronia udeis]|uniref:Uncharacterized protein n=1 Tax=Caballeronia udeis TaxID=1232866 RepID=A0A158GA10_9BURK|nr:hypothetical protein [Caballeronia udeis]SAL28691.1 hypothetical protein AWB69_02240 [Caballeronia udeis]
MTRTYEYHGYTLVVAVESDLSWGQAGGTPARVGYVAIVRIFQAGNAIAVFSPLRFGEAGGRPFATEADALMGGYSAARRIVDDLFSQESQ